MERIRREKSTNFARRVSHSLRVASAQRLLLRRAPSERAFGRSSFGFTATETTTTTKSAGQRSPYTRDVVASRSYRESRLFCCSGRVCRFGPCERSRGKWTPAKRTATSGETLNWAEQVLSRCLLVPCGFREHMLSPAGAMKPFSR